jgi:hypothetical protein
VARDSPPWNKEQQVGRAIGKDSSSRHSRKQQSKEGHKREQQVGRAVGKDSIVELRESSRVRRAVRESSRVGRAVGKDSSSKAVLIHVYNL